MQFYSASPGNACPASRFPWPADSTSRFTATRRRRRHRAVELPMTIASWGFVPALAAGNAVLVKPRDHPVDHHALAELGRESGPSRRLFQYCWQGLGGGASASSSPRRPQDRLHGLTEVASKVMGRRRRPGEAGDPWNSVQECHSCSTTAISRSPRPPRRWRVRQRRGRTAARAAESWFSATSTTSSGTPGAGGEGVVRR